MPKTAAQKRAEAKWRQRGVHRVAIDYTTADYARVSAAAEAAGFAVATFCRKAIDNQIAHDTQDLEPTPEELKAEAKRWANMTPEEMEAEERRLESKPFKELPLATQQAHWEIEEMKRTGTGQHFTGSAAELTAMILAEDD